MRPRVGPSSSTPTAPAGRSARTSTRPSPATLAAPPPARARCGSPCSGSTVAPGRARGTRTPPRTTSSTTSEPRRGAGNPLQGDGTSSRSRASRPLDLDAATTGGEAIRIDPARIVSSGTPRGDGGDLALPFAPQIRPRADGNGASIKLALLTKESPVDPAGCYLPARRSPRGGRAVRLAVGLASRAHLLSHGSTPPIPSIRAAPHRGTAGTGPEHVLCPTFATLQAARDPAPSPWRGPRRGRARAGGDAGRPRPQVLDVPPLQRDRRRASYTACSGSTPPAGRDGTSSSSTSPGQRRHGPFLGLAASGDAGIGMSTPGAADRAALAAARAGPGRTAVGGGRRSGAGDVAVSYPVHWTSQSAVQRGDSGQVVQRSTVLPAGPSPRRATRRRADELPGPGSTRQSKCPSIGMAPAPQGRRRGVLGSNGHASLGVAAVEHAGVPSARSGTPDRSRGPCRRRRGSATRAGEQRDAVRRRGTHHAMEASPKPAPGSVPFEPHQATCTTGAHIQPRRWRAPRPGRPQPAQRVSQAGRSHTGRGSRRPFRPPGRGQTARRAACGSLKSAPPARPRRALGRAALGGRRPGLAAEPWRGPASRAGREQVRVLARRSRAVRS
jgi:hypothetical protein